MLPRCAYRLAILIAGLFLIFQGIGAAHAAEVEDQSHHIDCVLCHIVAEQADMAVLPLDNVDAKEISLIGLPTFFGVIPKDIWAITPPERAPPPRGPPTTHI